MENIEDRKILEKLIWGPIQPSWRNVFVKPKNCKVKKTKKNHIALQFQLGTESYASVFLENLMRAKPQPEIQINDVYHH